MFSLCDWAAVHGAIEHCSDKELTALLAKRVEQLTEFDDTPLEDMAEFHIITAEDALCHIEIGLGFSPLSNLVDGSSYGDPDFEPSWETLEIHPGWIEVCFILSDSFGAVLFVQRNPASDPSLMALLYEYGGDIEPF
jgi:hypothetical protein